MRTQQTLAQCRRTGDRTTRATSRPLTCPKSPRASRSRPTKSSSCAWRHVLPHLVQQKKLGGLRKPTPSGPTRLLPRRLISQSRLRAFALRARRPSRLGAITAETVTAACSVKITTAHGSTTAWGTSTTSTFSSFSFTSSPVWGWALGS
eukprot:Amastigsp_a6982_116.p3 type:complete len:149 gc:universal Amastigsp_a6982_116:216-662(+)